MAVVLDSEFAGDINLIVDQLQSRGVVRSDPNQAHQRNDATETRSNRISRCAHPAKLFKFDSLFTKSTSGINHKTSLRLVATILPKVYAFQSFSCLTFFGFPKIARKETLNIIEDLF